MGIVSSTISYLSSRWNRWSNEYDKYVTNKLNAYPEIRNYENFEERIILNFLNKYLKERSNFAFIEAGSGTGRYMEVLGYKITEDIDRPKNGNTSYDAELSRRLKLIVGVDFAVSMIKIAEDKLRVREVYEKLHGKLKFVAKPIEDTDIKDILNTDELQLRRFVCCVFGTLGNIPVESRKEALKHMKTWAGEDGVVLLSVFNRTKLKELGAASYWAVQGLVGKPDFDYVNGDVKTGQGFISHWFEVSELCELSRECLGFRYNYLIHGDRLNILNEGRKLDSRRGLILIASNKEILGLGELLKDIKGDNIGKNIITFCGV